MAADKAQDHRVASASASSEPQTGPSSGTGRARKFARSGERSDDEARDQEARQLMLQAQRGDREAFGKVFDRYHRPVFNFFVRLCRDRTVAEDLVQETFLRLWRSAGRYHSSGKFTTYLFQIAKNYWLNEREKMARRRHLSLDSPVAGGRYDDTGASLKDLLSAPLADPHSQAASMEEADIARQAVDELDEKHRMVLILAYFHDFRYREIGEILEIPVGTVKTRMMHAERKLREKLKRRHLS